MPKIRTTLNPGQMDILCKQIKKSSTKERIKSAKAMNPTENALNLGIKKYVALLEKSLQDCTDEI